MVVNVMEKIKDDGGVLLQIDKWRESVQRTVREG